MGQAREKKFGDFHETAASKLEKLAVMLSKLPGQTHQSVLRMRICMLTVLLYYAATFWAEIRYSRLAVGPFSASWRLRVADPANKHTDAG